MESWAYLRSYLPTYVAGMQGLKMPGMQGHAKFYTFFLKSVALDSLSTDLLFSGVLKAGSVWVICEAEWRIGNCGKPYWEWRLVRCTDDLARTLRFGDLRVAQVLCNCEASK